jgi:hypothetical protein
MQPRELLEKKFNTSRNNLLAVIVFTCVNLLLAITETNLYFLFSANIPMYLLYFGSEYSLVSESFSFSSFGIIAAFLSVSIYGVFWYVAKKYRGWIIAALVYFSIDALLLMLFTASLSEEFDFSLIIDLAFTSWIMYYLITGTRAWYKLSKMPPDDESGQGEQIYDGVEQGKADNGEIVLEEKTIPVAQMPPSIAIRTQPKRRYSVVRHIWRAVYPVLIYFVVSFAVPIVAVIGYMIGLTIPSITSGQEINNDSFDAVTQMTETFSVDNLMLFQLLIGIICTMIFCLIWFNIRKALPKFVNASSCVLPAVLTLISFTGLHFILIFIMSVTNIIEHFPSYEEVSELLTSGSVLMQLLVVGIVGPVSEELLYRGILLNRLSEWMPKWVAIFVSSALFGVMHLNLFQGLYAFLLGVACAVLYVRYRNIWIPITGHIAFNSVNVIFRAIVDALGIEEFNVLILIILSALATGVAVFALVKFTKPAVPAYHHSPM